jgi:hypothetical protein
MMPAPLIAVGAMVLALAGDDASTSAEREATSFVRALWLIQRYGTVDAADPRNDIRAKAALAKALGKDAVLTAEGMKGLMEVDTFSRLAGPDGKLDNNDMRRLLEAAAPATRKGLFPKVAAHLDYLATSFELIDEPHRAAGEQLAAWIAERYRPDEPLGIVVVCTGNSRRSILGATMGNVAAAYCGMPEIRFYSGGIAPTAFNARTVTALREVGFEVEPTGKEAPRGEPRTANPIYRVRWGNSKLFESAEFSKLYSDDVNPHTGFAALMVCSEADAACPVVRGAALRISMPYLEPKLFDESPYEAQKYRERRDDIGRLMLSAMMHARRRLDASNAGRRTAP